MISFPLNVLLRSKHLFIMIFLIRGYMGTFIVIAHSSQYLSTHNETQLKRLWIIQWPQTEIFWMSFLSLLQVSCGIMLEKRKILLQFFYYFLKVWSSLTILDLYKEREDILHSNNAIHGFKCNILKIILQLQS